MLTKYVFPGGELDHLGNTIASLERDKFEVLDVEAWREHYQRTCTLWCDRLLACYAEATANVGEIKTRLWLALSRRLRERIRAQHGRSLSNARDAAPMRPSGLPATRTDLYR